MVKVITKTSRMAPITKKRGYTLIEMMVVTVLLVLFSSILVPNYVNFLQSQKRRAFYAGVVDVAGTARELAIRENSTMYLQADTSANAIVIKQEVNSSTFQTADGGAGLGLSKNMGGKGFDQNPQSNISTSSNDRANDRTIQTLPMTSSMKFGNFQLDGQASDSSSWKIRFFADGSCDAGAVELDDRGYVKSLVITARGKSSLVDGNIPDTSQGSWMAGNYVQRQQQ